MHQHLAGFGGMQWCSEPWSIADSIGGRVHGERIRASPMKPDGQQSHEVSGTVFVPRYLTCLVFRPL